MRVGVISYHQPWGTAADERTARSLVTALFREVSGVWFVLVFGRSPQTTHLAVTWIATCPNAQERVKLLHYSDLYRYFVSLLTGVRRPTHTRRLQAILACHSTQGCAQCSRGNCMVRILISIHTCRPPTISTHSVHVHTQFIEVMLTGIVT